MLKIRPYLSSELGTIFGSKIRNILIVLVVALTARLLVLVAYLPDDVLGAGGGDAVTYWQLSSEPFSHPGYLLRTPLYPKVIELIRIAWDSPTALVVFNIGISSATAVTTMLLAARSGLTSRYQMAAGLIVAIDPVTAFYSATALADPLFAFLIVLSGVMVLSGRSILAGLLVGGAGMVKPISVMLFVVMWSGKWRRYLIVSAIAITPLLLWSTHNYVTWNVFQPSSAGAYNLAFIRTPLIIREDTGESYESAVSSIIRQIEQEQPTQHPDRTTQYSYLDVTDSAVLSSMVSVSVREWIKRPKGFAISTLKGAYATLVRSPIGSVFGTFISVATLVLLGFAALGIMEIRRRTDLAILLGGTIAYFLIINIFVFGSGDARMRIPITPYLATLALLGIQVWAGRSRQKIDHLN